MKAQKYCLSHAGFVIEIVFEPTEFIYLQKSLIGQFKRVWGNFLFRPGKKADFIITVAPEATKDQVLVRESGKKYYFLTFSRDFQHRKVTIYYSASLKNLDMLFKEIFAYLAEKDGFLLHCSSLRDKKGRLSTFLARSGGGKTTSANLLKGKAYHKFGDDIIIVRKLAGKWKFFSPPFVEKDRVPQKMAAASARFFIVKKTKKPFLKRLENKKALLPFFLGQIWLRDGVLGKKLLAKAISFLKGNEFYELGATLNRKEMKGIFK